LTLCRRAGLSPSSQNLRIKKADRLHANRERLSKISSQHRLDAIVANIGNDVIPPVKLAVGFMQRMSRQVEVLADADIKIFLMRHKRNSFDRTSFRSGTGKPFARLYACILRCVESGSADRRSADVRHRAMRRLA
jgi:hypothetical protein